MSCPSKTRYSCTGCGLEKTVVNEIKPTIIDMRNKTMNMREEDEDG
jgi:hypothetical protein